MKVSFLAQLPFKDSAIGLISCSTGTKGLRLFISSVSVIVVNIWPNDSLQSVCVFLSCLGKGQTLASHSHEDKVLLQSLYSSLDTSFYSFFCLFV